MKFNLMLSAVLVLTTSSAWSQSNQQPPPGGQPGMGQPPAGGQPPPGGQPGMGQPPMGGQPGMGQPPTGGQTGMGQPQGGWSEEKCRGLEPKLRTEGSKCVDMPNANRRKTCFDKISKSMPPGFFDSCRMVTDTVKNEFEQKEKEKYPKQGSMLAKMSDGPKDGPNGGQPMDPARCEKELPKITKMADACLQRKKLEARRTCFDAIGKKFPPGFMDGCGPVFEPTKQAYMQKEKEMYPNQPSAMEGGGNSHGSQQTAGNTGKPANCEMIVTKIRTTAEKCLTMAEQKRRKTCFDGVGKTVSGSGAEQTCGDQMNAVKTEYQSKEQSKFPGQPGSIQ